MNYKSMTSMLLLLLTIVLFAACDDGKIASPDSIKDTQQEASEQPSTTPQGKSQEGPHDPAMETISPKDNLSQEAATNLPSSDDSAAGSNTATEQPSSEPGEVPPPTAKTTVEEALPVVAEPESITVLINKQYALPKDYEPKDLVFPDVPFTFTDQSDRRKMRSVAAKALELMFAGAKKDGILLAGVSAYRSYETQKLLFNRYVQKDGLEKARTYSAIAGTSEHETGLAIDVSGIDGKCQATDCFTDTAEAKWLALHASEYGFIVRYLKGKESITGYKYEPWHLRFVGTDIAAEIAAKGMVLEEYINTVAVSK